MESGDEDILFDWIIGEYKSGRTKRPQLLEQSCKCGTPVEQDGLALGFCRNHNLDCLIAFSTEVKIGAWSFKYFMETLTKFASGFRNDASNFTASPPTSPTAVYYEPKHLAPILKPKWKDFPDSPDSPEPTLKFSIFPDDDIPVIHPLKLEEWVNVNPPDYQLPDYDAMNTELENYTPQPFIRSLSNESFDFSHMMAG